MKTDTTKYHPPFFLQGVMWGAQLGFYFFGAKAFVKYLWGA
jgi:hypothetical protein